MKLEGGKWNRISWDQAYQEITDKLKAIREDKKSGGPDALFLIGSSKHSNEQSYLLCKWRGSGAATTPTTRRASAIRPPSPASRTPGATAR